MIYIDWSMILENIEHSFDRVNLSIGIVIFLEGIDFNLRVYFFRMG